MPQSAMQRATEKAARSEVGLLQQGRMLHLSHHQSMLADARRRTHDGHRAQMRALGEPDPGPLPEGDDVGNFVVTGDIYGSNAQQIVAALQGQSATATPTTPQQPATTPDKPVVPSPALTPQQIAWWQKVGQAAILAAAIATGGGGAAAMAIAIHSWLNRPTPAPVAPTTPTYQGDSYHITTSPTAPPGYKP